MSEQEGLLEGMRTPLDREMKRMDEPRYRKSEQTVLEEKLSRISTVELARIRVEGKIREKLEIGHSQIRYNHREYKSDAALPPVDETTLSGMITRRGYA